MTHLEKVLREYIPESKIKMAEIEIMTAMLKDFKNPIQISGLEGKESIIEVHENTKHSDAFNQFPVGQ